MSQLPPLKALVAFDAAMRNMSFSLAAVELHVTPGAVGQQIQRLEEWLGLPLFTRQVRQVHPTEAATAYWSNIRPALANIAESSALLKRGRGMSVSLSMPPGLAATWFMRRMTHLLNRHPEIELHLNATALTVDFERESVDLAIRHFNGQDKRLDASLLLKDEARVYCTPAYAKTHKLTKPKALVGTTLLAAVLQPAWEDWFHAFTQVDTKEVARIPRIHFDQTLLAIEAAKQGHGVVLTSPYLTEAETATKTFIEPFECCLPWDKGYYLVHSAKRLMSPAAERVKQWLLKEAGPSYEAAK